MLAELSLQAGKRSNWRQSLYVLFLLTIQPVNGSERFLVCENLNITLHLQFLSDTKAIIVLEHVLIFPHAVYSQLAETEKREVVLEPLAQREMTVRIASNSS